MGKNEIINLIHCLSCCHSKAFYVVFAHAKPRKLTSYDTKAWEKYCEGKILNKGKVVCWLCKMQLPYSNVGLSHKWGSRDTANKQNNSNSICNIFVLLVSFFLTILWINQFRKCEKSKKIFNIKSYEIERSMTLSSWGFFSEKGNACTLTADKGG